MRTSAQITGPTIATTGPIDLTHNNTNHRSTTQFRLPRIVHTTTKRFIIATKSMRVLIDPLVSFSVILTTGSLVDKLKYLYIAHSHRGLQLPLLSQWYKLCVLLHA